MHLLLNFKTLVTCSLLVLASVETYAESLEETITHEYAAASIQKLELSSLNGGITCVGSDTDTITIIATKKVRARNEETARTVLEQVEVDIQADGSVLRVKTKVPQPSGSFWRWLTRQHVDASVAYHITVPMSLSAELATVNGGITVESLRGGVLLKTVNGSIRGEGLGGSVHAKTVNGGIQCGVDQGIVNESSFEAVNGGVTVGLPSDAAFELKITTVNGRIQSDFQSSEEPSKKRGKLQATINGGGPKVKISTVNGSATMRSVGS